MQKMVLDDTIPQAQRIEAQRRPLSRGNVLSPTNESSSYFTDQTLPDRPGSSLKMLLSRKTSFRSSIMNAYAGRPALFRESSNQLSVPEPSRSPLPSPRVANSSTTDSPCSSIARASWDPPPLFQAHSQALRYALLDAPSASVESILRRQAIAISGGSTTPSTLDEATTSPNTTKKRKLRMPASVTFGWKRKLYVLVTSGYVLQYAADGHHDRLPEKILQLGHNSVAFASDAIAGRPYVLQVSHAPDQDDEPVDASTKSIWSRMGFRTVEEKRMAGSFLLICESPEELDAWMVAVRREIEAQGGAQYRCNTPRAQYDQSISGDELSEHLQACQGSPQSLERPPTPRAYSPPPKISAKYEPLPEINVLLGMWSDQAFSRRRSSTDSSVNTATELDHLRESSHCSSSTATGHRVSIDELHSPLSPAKDKVNETYLALTGSDEDAPLLLSPIQVPAANSEQCKFSVCDVGSRPVSGIPNFSLPTLSHRQSRGSVLLSDTSSVATREVLNVVNAEQSYSNGQAAETVSRRPTSTIAPLPSREAMARKPRSRVPSVEHIRPRTALASTALASSPSALGRRDSAARPSTPSSTYTLFPKRYSSPDVAKSLIASRAAEAGLFEPSLASIHRRAFSTPWLNESTNSLRVAPARRLHRPVSMHMTKKSSLEIETPKRSPAVTDLHFATNFGTADTCNSSSSAFPERPTSSVPQLELVSATIQRPARRLRRKAASSSAIGPPAGPPPTCPLPPPPAMHMHVRGSSVPAGFSSPRRIFLDLTTDG